jgi:hypothetical protein
MELTPEERRKIYEEGKARIEPREYIECEKRGYTSETGVSMDENVPPELREETNRATTSAGSDFQFS